MKCRMKLQGHRTALVLMTMARLLWTPFATADTIDTFEALVLSNNQELASLQEQLLRKKQKRRAKVMIKALLLCLNHLAEKISKRLWIC